MVNALLDNVFSLLYLTLPLHILARVAVNPARSAGNWVAAIAIAVVAWIALWAFVVVVSLILGCENCSGSAVTSVTYAIFIAVLAWIHVALFRRWRREPSDPGSRQG
jgi:hypothetical protein